MNKYVLALPFTSNLVDEGERAVLLLLLLKNPDRKCVYMHTRKLDSCVASGLLSRSKLGPGSDPETLDCACAVCTWTYLLYIKQMLFYTKKNNLTSGHSPATCPHFRFLTGQRK